MGEKEDDRILRNSDFYPHYDIIMRQNRVKNRFFTVEGTFLDGFRPNLVCELVGAGRRGRQLDFTKFRFLPPL